MEFVIFSFSLLATLYFQYKNMWLITGLGNPGNKYASTRHNLGFMVIESLSSKLNISLKNKSKNFTFGKGCIDEHNLILIKPITFMNRSGIAVGDACRKFSRLENMIVIHDDIDLDVGKIRIKKNGSGGGHKGIESIIELTGTKDFLRLKIGIGRSTRIPPEDYVLRPFTKKEQPVIQNSIENAVDAIEMIINRGISCAQNEFHKK